MRTHQFGKAGPQVRVIGQGTWKMGGRDRGSAVIALRRGLDLGMTHVDTAEMYGEAESVVAEAIAGRRDEVFLVSKVLPSNASSGGVREACERSLKRLQTDRLDCYLLHWPGEHPLVETIQAFEGLKADGKIRSWGVSNFDLEDLDAMVAAGGDGCVCNQVLYHLKERSIEHAVIPWCEKRGVAVVAYSPFGHDDFPAASSPGGRVLAEIGAAHGADTRQIALAFLTRRRSLFAIPKASDPDHATANAAAGDIVLGEAEIDRLDAAFPIGRRRQSLAMI